MLNTKNHSINAFYHENALFKYCEIVFYLKKLKDLEIIILIKIKKKLSL